jgi:hypothetical protein
MHGGLWCRKKPIGSVGGKDPEEGSSKKGAEGRKRTRRNRRDRKNKKVRERERSWFPPALPPTFHFPFSTPCSGHFHTMVSIGLHCNSSYPFTSSYPTYICVHFPFMLFNPEVQAAQSSETLVSNHLTLQCSNPGNHKF